MIVAPTRHNQNCRSGFQGISILGGSKNIGRDRGIRAIDPDSNRFIEHVYLLVMMRSAAAWHKGRMADFFGNAAPVINSS